MDDYLITLRESILNSFKNCNNHPQQNHHGYILRNFLYTFPSNFIPELRLLFPPAFQSTPIFNSKEALNQGYRKIISDRDKDCQESWRVKEEELQKYSPEEFVYYAKTRMSSFLYSILVPGSNKMIYGYSPKTLIVDNFLLVQDFPTSFIHYIINVKERIVLLDELYDINLCYDPIV